MRFDKEKSAEFKDYLKSLGYVKYVQNFKREDYLYWKSFERTERGIGGYSVGFAFYDFSKYPQCKDEFPISISYEFMLGNNSDVDRLDLTISDNRISAEQFEKFCKNFYEFYNTNKL